jgi:hypothetical protein
VWSGPKSHFTLWPKVERPSISTNQIARNQEFGLSTLRSMAKVQRPLQFKTIPFWRRRRTLEGSLGRTGMETQTMVKRLSVFLIRKSIIDKILAARSEGLFWARNKNGMLLWVWTLSLLQEASHYGRRTREAVWQSSWPKVRTLGLAFGGFTLCPAEGSTSNILLASYVQPISLDSQQSLATPLNPTASRLRRP